MFKLVNIQQFVSFKNGEYFNPLRNQSINNSIPFGDYFPHIWI